MSLDEHYRNVAKAIIDGDVAIVLGAGANLCGRPRDTDWQKGQYLPSGAELGRFLAKNIGCPLKERRISDLVRMSQYAVVMRGESALYKKLHSIFDSDYPLTPLHEFLAALPSMLRGSGCCPHQLILSTNYDDVLERAFIAAKEPFDLVYYTAEGAQRGKFVHISPGGKPIIIKTPNKYLSVDSQKQSVILKIHGSIRRNNSDKMHDAYTDDNYVITEDDYLDYLTLADITTLVPVKLVSKLKESNLLFLGYSLRDWNLRVMLHRIWQAEKLTNVSWAIQMNPDEVDRKFWANHGVEILDVDLEDYIAELSKRINEQLKDKGELLS
jgi:hypothetical protein